MTSFRCRRVRAHKNKYAHTVDLTYDHEDDFNSSFASASLRFKSNPVTSRPLTVCISRVNLLSSEHPSWLCKLNTKSIHNDQLQVAQVVPAHHTAHHLSDFYTLHLQAVFLDLIVCIRLCSL